MNYGSSKTSDLSRIVGAPAFRQGVEHYRKGIAPIFDSRFQLKGKGPLNNMWQYERGRQFAAYAEGKGVRLNPNDFFQNRKLRWEIRELASNAFFGDNAIR